MIANLGNHIRYDYQNFKQYLHQECVIDIIQDKYNYTEILPKTKFGNLTPPMFKSFIEMCLPEHANVLQKIDFGTLYSNYLGGN